MWLMSNIKTLISEIYILNFFQKCKLIEKVEYTKGKGELKKIESVLLEIKHLQENLLKKAVNNISDNKKTLIIKNLLSKSKQANIKLLKKWEEDIKILDNLLKQLLD